MSDLACVYRITNTVNGAQYIGVTKNPSARMNQHACHKIPTRAAIKNAIAKHGRDKFTMDILLYSTQEYCYMMEPKIIEAYNTMSPNGYNICKGGRGAVGLRGELNGMYGRRGEAHQHFGKVGYNKGKKLSEATKEKMRVAHLGQKRSLESCEKIKQVALNRSPELLQRMADARRAAFARKKGILT